MHFSQSLTGQTFGLVQKVQTYFGPTIKRQFYRAPWAVCCRTLEQHQEMHFPQSGVMHFSFAEDLHLCILLPAGEPPPLSPMHY